MSILYSFPEPASDVDIDMFQTQLSVDIDAMLTVWVEGFDTSAWEAIDWPVLIAQTHLVFSIFKATQGVTIIDRTFAFNKSSCQDHNYPWGAYHYYVPGDPIAQARYFVNAVGEGCDVYVCDVETVLVNAAIQAMRKKNAKVKIGRFAARKPDYPMFRMTGILDRDAQTYGISPTETRQFYAELSVAYLQAMGANALTLAQQVSAFLNEVKRLRPNAKLVLYSSPYFINTYLRPTPDFVQYSLWIAHVTNAANPIVPFPWAFWTLWQWTFSLRVPGATGALDGDRWYDDIDSLYVFFGNATPVPPVEFHHLEALTLVEGQNIRSGPGTSYPSVGTLHAGVIVVIGNISGPVEYWAKLYSASHSFIGWAAIKHAGRLYLNIRE